MKYVLFIDESGDQGLMQVRESADKGGASPFLTMGAALVPVPRFNSIRDGLSAAQADLRGKPLHCAELGHFGTAFLARKVAEQKVLLFGAISKKSTLGEYRDVIAGEKMAEDYYNKVSQYLLELVGQFLLDNAILSADFSVVFEEKRHDYSRLRAFIRACRLTPFDDRAKRLSAIDPLSISSEEKKNEPLLALADVTASALLQSVNTSRSNYGIAEQRYLREILPRFHRDKETGKVANYGIKYINGPVKMGLSGSEMDFAMKMYSSKDEHPQQ